MLIKLPRNIRVARRHQNKVFLCQLLSCCLFAITILTWLLIHTLTNHTNLTFPPRLQQASNVLLVLAHPDDESLFFGPTILQLIQRKPLSATHLLFLSAGKQRSPVVPVYPPKVVFMVSEHRHPTMPKQAQG